MDVSERLARLAEEHERLTRQFRDALEQSCVAIEAARFASQQCRQTIGEGYTRLDDSHSVVRWADGLIRRSGPPHAKDTGG